MDLLFIELILLINPSMEQTFSVNSASTKVWTEM